MRAQRRRTRLPISKSAESIQRHNFFVVVVFKSSNDAVCFRTFGGGGLVGVCHFQKKKKTATVTMQSYSK